jgi:membrane associated rhomboid family serine protease
MNPFQEFVYKARASGAPVTAGLVAAIVVAFLASFFSNGMMLRPQLAFIPDGALSSPWTFFTYPFAYPPGAIFAIFFGALWLWSIGGSVERELDSRRYGIFFFVMTALGALFLWIGALGMGVSMPLETAWMPTAAVTVAWGTRNPNTPLTFMFVLPITGRWLAWIAALFVFFGTSAQLAPFAALPLLFAYLFAAEKLPFAPWSMRRRADKKAEARFYGLQDDAIRREKEREERERLRRLFESSLDDDGESKRG